MGRPETYGVCVKISTKTKKRRKIVFCSSDSSLSLGPALPSFLTLQPCASPQLVVVVHAICSDHPELLSAPASAFCSSAAPLASSRLPCEDGRCSENDHFVVLKVQSTARPLLKVVNTASMDWDPLSFGLAFLVLGNPAHFDPSQNCRG